MKSKDIEGYANFNQELSKKILIKVLEGRIDPEAREKKMVLAYRESGLTPEKFLKKWKG
tara:strand:+ start:388 stop:564 length:177 start_codon:yes stop_codon:yes gene_type:complete